MLIKPGGCDNILYSNKSEDKCGICGGENKSCDLKQFEVNSPNKFGIYFFINKRFLKKVIV